MKKFNRRDTLKVLVVVIAIVVGALVFAAPKEAWAQNEHIVNVLHGDGSPWQELEVLVFVQTGPDPDDPDDWSVDWDVTNANGKVYINLLENSAATRWYYVLGEGYVGGDPLEGWVNYPSKFKLCRAAPGW